MRHLLYASLVVGAGQGYTEKAGGLTLTGLFSLGGRITFRFMSHRAGTSPASSGACSTSNTGDPIEMQIIRPHPGPSGLELRGVGPRHLGFKEPSRCCGVRQGSRTSPIRAQGLDEEG